MPAPSRTPRSARAARLAAAAAAAALLTGAAATGAAAATPVQDPVPIGPNQLFSGEVNGLAGRAPIDTTCIGPIVVGETGHPLPGQYVEAVPASGAASSTGFTGSAGDSLLVTLGGLVVSSANIIGTLDGYFIELPIPTTLTVPCAGTGVVTFTPEPTSPTARAATVVVDFVSQP